MSEKQIDNAKIDYAEDYCSTHNDSIYICLKHYKLNLKSGFVFLYLIIIFITLLIPVIIYLMYGREEFHETCLIYQRELPTHDNPVIVNAICCDDESIVGIPHLYGFNARMYELVRKGFLEFVEYEKNIIFKINYKYLELHKSELSSFEIEMIEIFEELGENCIVQFENVKKNQFQIHFRSWQLSVYNYLNDTNELKKYYISKGTDIALGEMNRLAPPKSF